MLKKLFLLVSFSVSLIINAQDEKVKTFAINGQVDGDYSGYVYFQTEYKDNISDSCLVKNNKFHFEGKLINTTRATLTLKKTSTVAFFYMENSAIDIVIGVSSFKNGNELINDIEIKKISGSKTQELMTDVENYQKTIETSDLSKEEKNKKVYKKYYETVTQNPDYPVLDFLKAKSKKTGYMSVAQLSDLESVVTTKKKVEQEKDSLIIRNNPKVYRRLKEGKELKNFTLVDQNGNKRSLSDFKGKYVLIDFWASWYPPSRKNNEELVKIHQKYKSKNFEMISVSIDTYVGNWKNAIEKDKLSWVNLIETGGWEGKVTKQFEIKGIPLNILLDKDGKILVVNAVGNLLYEKLEHHLN